MRLVLERPLRVPGLATDVAHPVIRPNNLDRYLIKLLRHGEPGATVDEVLDAAWFKTDHGWPACMVTSATRIAARYEILHLVAGVVIAAPDTAALAAASEAIATCLRSARPDFADELVCLTKLWT